MKKFFYLPFVILLIVILFFVPVVRRESKSFLYRLTGKIEGSFSNSGSRLKQNLSFLLRIGDLKRQNDDLSAKIINLEVDKSQITELETENKLLKEEIGFFEANKSSQLVPAKIIERDPTAFLDYVIVDKGHADGLGQGMAVVSSGVLVGTVSEVFDTSAKITLITSKDSIIQAMLQDCRAKGIMRGGISGLTLENIFSDADYKTGENVVTSGLGGMMKEGILIGKAGKAESSSSEIFKSIAVEPLVDFSRLELVFIQK